MEVKRLVSSIKFENFLKKESTNYLTHNFHPYPAKFIPQIPKFTIKTFTQEGDTILDPFCGSGTSLVEARLLNRNAIGVDLNPIATLVSKAKTNKINQSELNKIPELLKNIKKDIYRHYNKVNIKYNIPKFNNINHWFQLNVIAELGIIKTHIDKIKDEKLKDYLYTAFSAILVKVSNQESDTRFAAIDKHIKNLETFSEFLNKLTDMDKRMREFSKIAYKTKIKIFTGDARNMYFLKDNSIDHIVTSPPYANTYDYYLYHKFRIYWLGYDLKGVQDNEIGSRDRHSSKKEEIITFEEDINRCIKEMGRVIKPGKVAVIVIGDSVIRGKVIRMDTIMKRIGLKNNFKFIRDISYNLKQNSRAFNPKFTNGEKLEHIMFFQNGK